VLFLMVVILSPLLVESKSFEFNFDPSVDTSLLPYSVIIQDAAISPCDRPPIRHSLRAVKVTSRLDEIPTYVEANNPVSSDAPAAHLNWNPLGHRVAFDQRPLLGTLIEDIAVVPRGDTLLIFGTALREDSLRVFRVTMPNGGIEWLTIAPVIDRDGDGKWSGSSSHLLTADYDFDGHTELFFYFNAVRDVQPRELICIEAESFQLEWSLKVAPLVHTVFTCGDSSDPGVIFATGAPGQNVNDSIFSDRFGYLVRVDRTGKVVFAHQKSTFPNYLHLGVVNARSEFYVLGLNIKDTTGDTRLSSGLLELVSATGQTISQVSDSDFNGIAWPIDLNEDGIREIIVFNRDRSIQVFSAELEKLYHSEPGLPSADAGVIERFDGVHDARLISMDGGATGIYDAHFNLLALLPKTSQGEVLARDTTGQVTTLILNNYSGHHYFAQLTKRTTRELAVIFYRKNHVYFLSGSFALLAALMVTAFYQRRTRSNLRIINSQKAELELAHQQLQDAQPAIIAQEKYLQAKDIAGGFAHEIRNALFPADSALTQVNQMTMTGNVDPARVSKHMRLISSAVSRAIGITQLITQYTKLESERIPEKVDLPGAIRAAFAAHRQMLDQQEVKVTVSGPDSLAVLSNHTQLGMVLGNLILNSLDALTNRQEPTILVRWERLESSASVTFNDNGCGIAADDLHRVFDTFFSTKPSHGTGLGLATTKRIVELYGGGITLSSEPGSGTTFTIRLRLVSQE
jgi:signal transduction histidine kinase